MMRRELGKIYSRFYCSVILGVALVYHMWDFTVVLLLFVYSFWIPQIFVNAYFDSRKSLSNHYMYGMSASRLFLPLYYYGCPNSFIIPLNRWEPKPSAALLLVLWMALQLCALPSNWNAVFFTLHFVHVWQAVHRRVIFRASSSIWCSCESGKSARCSFIWQTSHVSFSQHALQVCATPTN